MTPLSRDVTKKKDDGPSHNQLEEGWDIHVFSTLGVADFLGPKRKAAANGVPHPKEAVQTYKSIWGARTRTHFPSISHQRHASFQAAVFEAGVRNRWGCPHLFILADTSA